MKTLQVHLSVHVDDHVTPQMLLDDIRNVLKEYPGITRISVSHNHGGRQPLVDETKRWSKEGSS